MRRDWEVDEESDWKRAYDNAFVEEKRKRALEDVPDEDLSKAVFDEIDKAARDQVGQEPDEEL